VKVLLLGSGGREHAMAWALGRSPRLEKLWSAPGNAGTADYGENLHGVRIADPEAVADLARRLCPDLVVVGPEDPLAAGVADRLTVEGVRVFGPSSAAAEIESSKAFAKGVMARAGIATAAARDFEDEGEALGYLRERAADGALNGAPGSGIVVKADGLAAGKGVTVCDTLDQAEAAVREAFGGAFGVSGERVLIEQRLTGRETSAHAFTDGVAVAHMPFSCDHKPVFDGNCGPNTGRETSAHAFTDGVAVAHMPFSCDHKPVFDGNCGPNTGGMGCYSPPGWLPDTDAERIRREVTERAVVQLAAEGRPYRGVIYPGMMMTADGPRVIEFNCRLGDPEAEVLLPRLRTELLAICEAVTANRLGELDVQWDERATVGVVMASPGYPGDYPRGAEITGVEAVDPSVHVFFAGAQRDERGRLLTAGGRVLCVVAAGDSVEEARSLSFEGAHYRTDIALDTGAVTAGTAGAAR
jgi:phosphoribosylamine--glycine ligase